MSWLTACCWALHWGSAAFVQETVPHSPTPICLLLLRIPPLLFHPSIPFFSFILFPSPFISPFLGSPLLLFPLPSLSPLSSHVPSSLLLCLPISSFPPHLSPPLPVSSFPLLSSHLFIFPSLSPPLVSLYLFSFLFLSSVLYIHFQHLQGALSVFVSLLPSLLSSLSPLPHLGFHPAAGVDPWPPGPRWPVWGGRPLCEYLSLVLETRISQGFALLQEKLKLVLEFRWGSEWQVVELSWGSE